MQHTIEQRLLGLTQKKLISARFIIAHDSGNPRNTGATALENEIRYMSNQARKGGSFVSHWVGGGGKIVQLAQTGKIQYGAGSKANGYAYAQVELARTKDPHQFLKDYEAYIWLLRMLATEANLPLTLNTGNSIHSPGIKTHHWISTCLGGTDHTDPDAYLKSFGISLKQFAKDLQKGFVKESQKPQSGNPASTQPVWIVKKGETLWSIAKQSGLSIQTLKECNHLFTDTIHVGQVLRLEGARIETGEPSRSFILQSIQKSVHASPDGKFGPKTRKAILQLYQKARDVKADGFWGPLTASKARVIRFGSQGQDVYAVQAMLFGLGFEEVGMPDSHAGPKTIQGIRSFQKKHKLQVDGLAGPRTLESLFTSPL